MRHDGNDSKAGVLLSKRLAYVLRHHPESIGLTLGPGGWVRVDDLLAGLSQAGVPVTREQLTQLAEHHEKQRFILQGERIRAAQGHSLEVDLELDPASPPAVLFHGTAHHLVSTIRKEGLHRGTRQHVHLSADAETARAVGARHGRPVVLVVLAQSLYAEGYRFFRADNGVWLTRSVPPHGLQFEAEPHERVRPRNTEEGGL